MSKITLTRCYCDIRRCSATVDLYPANTTSGALITALSSEGWLMTEDRCHRPLHFCPAHQPAPPPPALPDDGTINDETGAEP